LFLYYNERVLENEVDQDSGASLEDGFNVLRIYGICPESDWTYDISRFKEKPNKKAFSDAQIHKCYNSFQVEPDVEQFKKYLSEDIPICIGFDVYDSFMTLEVAKTGLMPVPNKMAENILGGHAVVIVGYNEKDQTFLVRNSWGEDWGIKGHFKMPFELIKSLVHESWVIIPKNHLMIHRLKMTHY
jgi:C1A family cysteine protease